MNQELLNDMNRWSELKRELDLVEARIKAAVLEAGNTQAIGDVEAVFEKPKKTYDYEGAVEQYDGGLDVRKVISANSAIKTNWYRVCNGLGIDRSDIEYTEGEPRVRVKLR